MVPSPTPESTRRPGVESLSITLADGRAWGLALPSLRLSPRVVGGVDALGRPLSTIRVATRFAYPLEIRQLVEELRLACERGDPEHQYESLIRLASALVIRAHDIDLAEALRLMELEINDFPRLVEAVISVVTGESPRDLAIPESKVNG